MDTQLDPTVVNLAKAIRQTESGGNFSARGKSGEMGGYQFTEPTWSAASSKYGINVPLEKATPEQQNAVAYNRIKEWKDSGKDVTQIASMWNAGEGESNAYTGKFSDGRASSGVNKFGARFDVPAYAKSVAGAYLALKNGQNVGVDPNNPSSVPNTEQINNGPGYGMSKEGTPGYNGSGGVADFLGIGKLGQGIGQTIANAGGAQDKTIQAQNQGMNIAGQLEQRIQEKKSTGQDTSQLESALASINADIQSEASQTSELGTGGLKNKEVVGSALSTAALAVPGIGSGASTVGKIGAGAATGYLFDVGQQLQDKAKTVPEAFKPGFATALGAILPGIGAALGKVSDKLPSWLVQKALPKLQESPEFRYFSNSAGGYTRENIGNMTDFVLNKKGFTVGGLLKSSQQATGSLESSIKSILTHPQYESEVGNISAITQEMKDSFANSEKLQKDKSLINIIKSVAPENSSIVTKVFNGTATLEEQNILRKELDFKTYSDDPIKIFNKKVGKTLAGLLRTNIQTTATETQRVFAEYNRELGFREALFATSKKLQKQAALGLYDIAAMFGGGIPAVVTERTVRAPATQIGIAKGIRKAAGSKALGTAGRLTKKALILGGAKANSKQ